jgi:hypothetical protein
MKKIILSTVALASICLGADTKSLPDISNTEAWKGLTYVDVANSYEFKNNEGGGFFSSLKKDPELKNHLYKDLVRYKKVDEQALETYWKAFETVCVSNGNTYREMDESEKEAISYRDIGDRSYANKHFRKSKDFTKNFICENPSKEIEFIMTTREWQMLPNALRIIIDVSFLRETVKRSLINDAPKYRAEKEEQDKLTSGNLTPLQLRELANKKQEETYQKQKEACDGSVAKIKKTATKSAMKGKTSIEMRYSTMVRSDGSGVFNANDANDNSFTTSCPHDLIVKPLEAEGYKIAYPKYNNDGTPYLQNMVISW